MSDLDPLADLIALGRKQKAAVLQQNGGTRSVLEVAELLGVTPEAVDDARCTGKLIAVPGPEDFVYPAVQFAKGAVLQRLPELLDELESSSWTALFFLVTPIEQLSERSPLDVLRSGTVDERMLVLRLARILAGDGFG
jgi:hypothetical protein